MHRRQFAVLALLAACVLGPTAAEAATPKSNGGYYKAAGKSDEYANVVLTRGRITGVGGGIRLVKDGKACRNPDPYRKPVFTVTANLLPGFKPAKNGSFSFKTTSGGYGITFPVTVSGKFTSSTRATIKISASFNGCTGSFKTTRAKYSRLG